jgi:hypothetical protein
VGRSNTSQLNLMCSVESAQRVVLMFVNQRALLLSAA